MKQKLCKLCKKNPQPSWVAYCHHGPRKHLIAGTEFCVLSCPPPTGPASSCSITPDNETSVKATGQSSKRGFPGNTCDNKREHNSSMGGEGLERYDLSKSVSTFQVLFYCQTVTSALIDLTENIKQDHQSNSDNSGMACENQITRGK